MFLQNFQPLFFRKNTVIRCMAAALILSAPLSGPVYAGPAEDTTIGMSTGPAADHTGVPSYIHPQYYDSQLKNPVVQPADLYSYEQMEQDINALSGRYQNLVTVNVIGQSLDGRKLYDVIVGSPSAPKQVMIQGAIHAREYITVPLMMQQLESLLAGYDTGYYNDIPLADLLNSTAIHFIPMANPDGVSLSQFGEGAIRSDGLRQVIQTCYALDTADQRTTAPYDQYLRRWKSNANGIDLNHNFDAGWGRLNATLFHNSATNYKGPAPLSEPESQALASLANQYRFHAVINYHSMGNVIYWDTEQNRQAQASLDLANRVSAAGGYTILPNLGAGGYKDWLQQRDASVPGITIEVGSTTAPVSFSEYPAIWDQNKMVPGILLVFAKEQQ